MRKIIFRGKDPFKEWVYGELQTHFPMPNMNPVIHTYYSNGSYGKTIQVNEDTLGQFTGLHDKNGKEIYEGDIVSQPGLKPYFVTWNTDRTSFEYGRGGNAVYNLDKKDAESFVVIGNIHDNPELLKNED